MRDECQLHRLLGAAITCCDYKAASPSRLRGGIVPSLRSCFVRAVAAFALCAAGINAWALQCDIDNNDRVDKVDLGLISKARGTPPQGANDPRDANGDGIISLDDVQYCIRLCTYPSCATRLVPVANAGPDQTAGVGATVTLSGAGSSDPGGQLLSYRWSFSARAAGSVAVLIGADTVRPSFGVDRPGSYTVQLIVNNGSVDSVADTVVVNTVNSVPVANAGPDQSVHVSDTATLDGRASSDVDGDSLTYAWRVVSAPASSTAVLSSTTAAQPQLIIDVAGVYELELVVHDGTQASLPDLVVVSTVNTPPVSKPSRTGSTLAVPVGTNVTLDGSASFDVDGDPLTHRWSLTARPAGSAAVLSAPNSVNPSFVADMPGSYVAQLIVNDGSVDSTPASITISTDNAAPNANAGADQSAPLGATVQLNGAASSDPEGMPLNFAWSLTTGPAGSAAMLAGANTATPSFVADVPGIYIAQLIVSDGMLASAPDTVVVSTLNSRPVAEAGAPQAVNTGGTVLLDGSASRDADGDTLSYTWSFTSLPAGSVAVVAPSNVARPSFLADMPGTYVAQLIVSDSSLSSVPATVTVTATMPNQPPVAVAVASPTIVNVSSPVALSAAGSGDPDGNPITYAWSVAARPPGSNAAIVAPTSASTSFTPDVAGQYALVLTVSDGALSANAQAIVVANDAATMHSPVIVSVPTTVGIAGTPYVYDVDATDVDVGDVLTYSLATAPQGMGINPATGLISWTPPSVQTGAQSVIVRVADQTGLSVTQAFAVTVTTPGASPPPEIVAPPNDPTVATNPFDSTRFLYSGAAPVQTGVAEGTIVPARVAVLRGRVLGREGQPLQGAKVQVHQHPEFGQTLSRADGVFDMAVNGGEGLTLTISLPGFLPAQVSMGTSWQAFAVLGDVVLVPLDAAATSVQLGAGQPSHVARGNPVNDARGTRQATVHFPAGVTAEMLLPDGSTQVLGQLTVRATEYTMGSSGPRAMPGSLPATSGYTYAVELSVDEAMAAGATSVRFSRAVPMYVENFLGFPVGSIVPVGYYDRQAATWVPAPSGRVIRVVGRSAGLALVDANGDGLADTPAQLAALGIDDDERTRLATLYADGTALWRVQLDHFTPWDCNWPFGPPDDARAPGLRDPRKKQDICPAIKSGSIIECQNQVLGEVLPVNGTPFSLNYKSDRTPGWRATDLDISLSGSDLPASLASIVLEVEVAGQHWSQRFPAQPNQSYNFSWNGLDAYGRPAQGAQMARVRIGYIYPGVYREPSSAGPAFAAPGGVPISGNIAAREVTMWQTFTVPVGEMDARSLGLGGWSLSAHHRYDAVSGTVYMGGGGRRQNAEAGGLDIITTLAGDGTPGDTGDGGPATQARVNRPGAITVDAAGNVFFVDTGNHRLRRISPEGIMSTVAPMRNEEPYDNFWNGSSASGVPTPSHALASAGAGQVYVTSSYYDNSGVLRKVIERIDTLGARVTVAGLGNQLDNDGGPALQSRFSKIVSMSTDAVGNLIVLDVGGADCQSTRVFRIDKAGTVTRLLGGRCDWGTYGNFLGEFDRPATVPEGFNGINALPHFTFYEAVAAAPDGALFASETPEYDAFGYLRSTVQRLVRVDPKGTFRWFGGFRVANADRSADGDFVKNTQLTGTALVATAQGEIITAEALPFGHVRKVDVNGIVRHVAGVQYGTSLGDGGSAGYGRLSTGAHLSLAVDAAGAVYVADSGDHRIRRIGKRLPGYGNGEQLVPSADGSEVYRFAANGRHLQTLQARTRAVLLDFGYSPAGLLTSVTDADGNITLIERAADGTPQAIVAPYGQRTVLVLNADGFLSSVADPGGRTHNIGYTADGLLNRFERPSSAASTMVYDAQGRLRSDTNAAGGGWVLGRTEVPAEGDRVYEAGDEGYTLNLDRGGRTVSTLTTALGVVSEYRTSYLTDGSLLRTTVEAGATTTQREFSWGNSQLTAADGTVVTQQKQAHPRLGSFAPLGSTVTLLPSGLQKRESVNVSAVLANPNDVLSVVTEITSFTTNARTVTQAFTAATGITTLTTPAGRGGSTTQHPTGRVLATQWTGLAPMAYEYDTRGRLAVVRQGSGVEERLTQLRYGADGHLAEWEDALGQVHRVTRNAVGQPTQLRRPDTQSTTLTYDANGNLSTLTPPGQPAHGMGYDLLDQAASYTPPTTQGGGAIPGAGQQTPYDLDHRLQRWQREDGSGVDLAYDTQGRLFTATPTPGTGAVLTWHYSATTGQLVQLSGGDAGLTYTYDGALPSEDLYAGALTGARLLRQYDSDFRIRLLTVGTGAGASTVEYIYDDDSLITSAGAMTLTRHPQHGLATATQLGSVSTQHDYNAFGEPALITATAGTEVLRIEQTYDKLGRVSSRTESLQGEPAQTRNYEYDLAGRLVRVTSGGTELASWAYDANGNRTHENGIPLASHDAQDRLLGHDGDSRSYSASGELQSITRGASSTNLSYDIHGQLRRVELPAGATVEYLTDALNRRIARKVNGSITQRWVWQDGLRIAAEVDEQGQVLARYVYAEKPNVPEYMDRGGQRYRLVTDALGSVRLVVNTQTAQVLQRMDYDEWGRVTQDTNPGFQPFGYAGGLYEPETGLTRFGVRDYEAKTGRWTAKDPIGFNGGQENLYAYVSGNPISNVDPYGLFGWADMPSVPQGVVDFGAGMGDVILFGQGQRLRDLFDIGGVDRCSSEYDAGEWAGIAASFAAGAAGGLKAAGTKGAGREFSHWIPNRMGGPRSVMNGNFVSTEVHALSDPFRYRFMPRTWKAGNPMPSRANQQWVRIPNVYKGAGAGGVYGAGGAAMNDCTCSR